MQAAWWSSTTVVFTLLTLRQMCDCVRPYVDHATCPRQYDELRKSPGRTCLRKCLSDAECRGRNRRCICDGPCGNSCVKSRSRCDPLEELPNGQMQITGIKRPFGAVVRYSCDDGYVLSGPVERVCGADGTWSETAPSCDTDGSKCRQPPVIEHALHDGNSSQKSFPVGTQLVYRCKTGYNAEGFFRAMCVGEGRWIGPRISCSPRRCGPPGEIVNGFKNGSSFVYPNRVIYHCNEGYELIGRQYRVCQADGRWSGSVPSCRQVECEMLKAPDRGQMTGDGVSFGSVIRFSCDKGFQMVGLATRRCQQDGTWSGTDVQCRGVDCGPLGPFPNGRYIYSNGHEKTSIGTVVKFQCADGTKFEGASKTTTCQANGTWSQPVPKCLNRCSLPRIANGTVIDRYSPVDGATSRNYVEHGGTMTYNCSTGFTPGTDSTATCCNNGTWMTEPTCLPAPCSKRPEDLTNGIVRVHTAQHGDRAQYECDAGFTLKGDMFALCQYGLWTQNTPECLPKHCDFPGQLDNGTIRLVGVVGKFEYREYAGEKGHNDKIEYQCNKEFWRDGPSGATCIDGKWSPPGKPRCVPKHHPRLYYMFRGRRGVYTVST